MKKKTEADAAWKKSREPEPEPEPEPEEIVLLLLFINNTLLRKIVSFYG